MKHQKKPEPGPPVSARVWVIEVPAEPEKLLERYHALALADAKRTAEFRRENERKRRDSRPRHQEYRDIARKLYAQGRASRRSTRNRLAQLIQEELVKDGRLNNDGRPVHIRTITRALAPKK